MDDAARHDRIEALEADNDRLRERIAELEAAFGMDVLPPIEWRLTMSEARVFGVILKRELASKEAIMVALYGFEERADPKIADVFVCKIRGKLKPFGVQIRTRWGHGYFMDPADRALARSMIEREAA